MSLQRPCRLCRRHGFASCCGLFEPQNATSAELPLEESFDNGHMPAGWSVDLVDAYNLVKDMYAWRFDNWFNSEINAESGINGGFASVSGVAAGMNRLESYLVTPIFDVPEEGEVVVSFDKYFFEDTPGLPTGLFHAFSLYQQW